MGTGCTTHGVLAYYFMAYAQPQVPSAAMQKEQVSPFKRRRRRAGKMTQLVECFPHQCEDLSSESQLLSKKPLGQSVPIIPEQGDIGACWQASQQAILSQKLRWRDRKAFNMKLWLPKTYAHKCKHTNIHIHTHTTHKRKKAREEENQQILKFLSTSFRGLKVRDVSAQKSKGQNTHFLFFHTSILLIPSTLDESTVWSFKTTLVSSTCFVF